MSWDATLCQIQAPPACANCGHPQGEPQKGEVAWFNYTHNTNSMIAAAVKAATGAGTPQCDGPLGGAIGPAWWKRLDGTSGSDGAAYLGEIIRGMESDPERFRAMSPPNGWGDYDRLLAVLREMRDAPAAFGGQTEWRVSG